MSATAMPKINGRSPSRRRFSSMMETKLQRNQKPQNNHTKTQGNLGINRSISPLERSEFATYSSKKFDINLPVFTVRTDQLNRSQLKITQDSLQRLVVNAKHKVDRLKYDSTNEKCKQQKQNIVTTGEDQLDSQTLPWIQSLRPNNPEKHQEYILQLREIAKKQGKTLSKNDDDDDDQDILEQKQDAYMNVGPPDFYEDDMQKWQKKFQRVTEARKKEKYKLNKSVGGTNFNVGTKNSNVYSKEKQENQLQKVMKRRKSRESINSFNVMNFQYIGNTSDFSHLIKRSGSNPSCLNFELNLRKYANRTNFNSEQVWQYPQTKQSTPLKSQDKIFSLIHESPSQMIHKIQPRYK